MQPMQQDLLANGNYAQFLAHALTPPNIGGGMMGSYGGPQGIGPHLGHEPGFGQFGGQFGSQFGQGLPGQGSSGAIGGGVAAQPGYGYQGFGQPLAAQQQQIAATLHQLAHQSAAQAQLGQQVGATLHQLAQYVASQGITGQQIAAVLGQLAHQCAWQAQATWQNRHAGFGSQAVYGQPFGYGQGNVMPFGHAGGVNRPLW
jgi:hypothetical protein